MSIRARANKFKQWKRRFKVIKNSIFDLALKRFVFQKVTELVRDNPRLQTPSVFYDWLHKAYAIDMTIHIRRLTDTDKRSISFVNLMKDIERYPEVMSRRRFTLPYKGFMKQFGHKDFDRLAKPGSSVLNKRLIAQHKAKLVKSHKRLRSFTNKHVAHLDIRGMRRFPTYEELNACVDTIESLLKDYALLLEQSAPDPVVPVIQYDWMAPFRLAWLPNKKTHESATTLLPGQDKLSPSASIPPAS